MTETETETEVEIRLTRDEIRKTALAHRPVKKKIIRFHGVDIELRQPSLGDVIRAQGEDDRTKGVINTLIDYAYVPGTDEKVFEEADADVLMNMPFGKDFVDANKALEELTEVNFLDQKPG